MNQWIMNQTSSERIARASTENAVESTTAAPLDKAALRQRMLTARKAVGTAQRFQWDGALCEQLLAWWSAHPVATLGVYRPMQEEPDLGHAYTVLVARGVQLALPLVVARDAALEFAAWLPDEAVVKDDLGLTVPAVVRRVTRPQALLIPCLAYNAGNFRLGYGGGFYDRTLAIAPRPLAIGIAYSFSRANFATEPHDIGLDCVLTEAG